MEPPKVVPLPTKIGDPATHDALLIVSAINLPRLHFERHRVALAKQLSIRPTVLDSILEPIRIARGQLERRAAIERWAFCAPIQGDEIIVEGRRCCIVCTWAMPGGKVTALTISTDGNAEPIVAEIKKGAK